MHQQGSNENPRVAEGTETLSRCPLCGASRLTQLSVPGHWIGEQFFSDCRSRLGLSRCRNCSFVFTNPRPSPSLLERFYNQCETYACHQPSYNARLGIIRQLLSVTGGPGNGKKLLDFGCGGGVLVVEAIRQGWNAVGFDPSRQAVENCRQAGIPATNRLDELEAFDVVIAGAVLEHVADWGEFFESISQHLRPDGQLVLAVPNTRSLRALAAPFCRRWSGDERYFAFPIHLSHFTPRTLPVLLRKYGFTPSRILTRALGIDDLFPRSQSHSSNGGSSLDNALSTADSPLKREAKALLFDRLKLGNELIAVCRLSSSRTRP